MNRVSNPLNKAIRWDSKTMPAPDDVNTNDMYDRFGPEPLIEKTAGIRSNLMATVQDPQNAPGWFGVIVPAVVTAIAIQGIRRYL